MIPQQSAQRRRYVDFGEHRPFTEDEFKNGVVRLHVDGLHADQLAIEPTEPPRGGGLLAVRASERSEILIKYSEARRTQFNKMGGAVFADVLLGFLKVRDTIFLSLSSRALHRLVTVAPAYRSQTSNLYRLLNLAASTVSAQQEVAFIRAQANSLEADDEVPLDDVEMNWGRVLDAEGKTMSVVQQHDLFSELRGVWFHSSENPAILRCDALLRELLELPAAAELTSVVDNSTCEDALTTERRGESRQNLDLDGLRTLIAQLSEYDAFIKELRQKIAECAGEEDLQRLTAEVSKFRHCDVYALVERYIHHVENQRFMGGVPAVPSSTSAPGAPSSTTMSSQFEARCCHIS